MIILFGATGAPGTSIGALAPTFSGAASGAGYDLEQSYPTSSGDGAVIAVAAERAASGSFSTSCNVPSGASALEGVAYVVAPVT
ncbi:MAG: hypothetical protein WBA31_08355 [Candidatus Dormiibacterota bacterium]